MFSIFWYWMTKTSTYNLHISDFLYRWPEVRPTSRPLHYKSIKKYWNPSRSQKKTHRKAQYFQDHAIIGHSWLSICNFWSVTLRESSEVTRGHQRFSGYNCRQERDRDLKWSLCFCLVETHQIICSLTYLGHYVTLTCGQILTLTFQGHLIHVSMRNDKANAMVSKSLLFFQTRKLSMKTRSAQKCHFWPFVTSDA